MRSNRNATSRPAACSRIKVVHGIVRPKGTRAVQRSKIAAVAKPPARAEGITKLGLELRQRPGQFRRRRAVEPMDVHAFLPRWTAL